MKIFKRYDYDTNARSEHTGLSIDTNDERENRTKQEFKEEVDINTILRRFNITGQLPENVRMPTYEDFTEVYDFHSAANAIAQANEAFEQMPAEVRLRFGNDPSKFLDFCDKDQNREEAERLGLVRPKPKETPPTTSTGGVPVAPPPQSDTTERVT